MHFILLFSKTDKINCIASTTMLEQLFLSCLINVCFILSITFSGS